MGEDFPAVRSAALDALGIDRDHDALLAEFLSGLLDEFAAIDGGRVDRDLVGAGSQQRLDVFDAAHSAAYRQRHETGLRGSPHHIQHGAAVFVGCRDIEKAELIGAGSIISDRAFDGIAGIAQIDEIDALNDASVLHVEARDDARFKHRRDF